MDTVHVFRSLSHASFMPYAPPKFFVSDCSGRFVEIFFVLRTEHFSNNVEKFVSCRSKDINKRELYIVEGDSALTSCKLGRDAEFQAIIPVRGKTLNCLKSSYDKIFKSDIIVDLLRLSAVVLRLRALKPRIIWQPST